MQSDNPLDKVIFISLPEHLAHYLDDVGIARGTLLPVDTGGDTEEWNPDALSWEMILSGMLKVLAYEPDHEDSQMYREFVRQLRPEIVTELSETGIIAARNGNYEIAEEIFTALTGLAPERLEGPVNLAIAYEQHADALDSAGKQAEADRYREQTYETYRVLLAHDDVTPDARLNAGLFYLKIRDMDAAYEQLEQFVRESDDAEKRDHAQNIVREIEAQNLRDEQFREAYHLIRNGEETAGVARITAFLESNPDVWNAWFLLGWGQRRLEEYDEAIASFERAISLGANNADTFNELAICHLERGNFAESRNALREALTREPDNTKIMSNFGVLALKEGNVAEARQFFLTVQELQPDDPVARQYLAMIETE